MRDPYDVLGVPRNAPEADIKKAFRKLAKQWHPDTNKGDKRAKDKFAELNTAYEILGDKDKRAQFDRGEIDAEGKPRFQGFEGFRQGGGPGAGGFDFNFRQGHPGQGGFAGGQDAGFDPSDIFADLFGGGGRRRRSAAPPPGEDIRVETSIPIADAAKGTKARVTLPNGRTVEVTIPAGVTDGQVIRLKKQGEPSPFGGPQGDAYVTVRLKMDSRFTVDGQNLRIRLPVPLEDAVLGGPLRVPTLDGTVELSLPANSSSGRTMRLRGKGLPGKDGTGDLLVTIEITLPAKPDADLEALMRKRREAAAP